MIKSQSTLPKTHEVKRVWWLLDGNGQSLGRLATQAATILRGKHKAIFTPSVDTGDHVVVINAEKVVLTGNKLEQKMDFRHSQYPGGHRLTAYKDVMKNQPEKAVMLAVKGMLPKNPLGRKMLTKIRVHRGAVTHHTAQQPVPYVPPVTLKLRTP